MKNRSHLRAGFSGLVFILAVFSGTSISALANESHHEDSSATTAEAKADYPLSTCVVSGDKLEGGDMGPPIDYVYKQEGKPDRLVRFCCKGCIKDFKKDPAKYLKKIDDAAAAKAKGEKPVEDAPAGQVH
jgi:hypothetical protein